MFLTLGAVYMSPVKWDISASQDISASRDEEFIWVYLKEISRLSEIAEISHLAEVSVYNMSPRKRVISVKWDISVSVYMEIFNVYKNEYIAMLCKQMQYLAILFFVAYVAI